jgi:hypothetical protein
MSATMTRKPARTDSGEATIGMSTFSRMRAHCTVPAATGRADQAADQRVRRGGRQAEVPGDQVPAIAPSTPAKTDAEAGDRRRQRDHAAADRLGDLGAEVGADEVADRGHRQRDARGQGAGADAGGDGVRRVVESRSCSRRPSRR